MLSKICKAHSIVPASYLLRLDFIRIDRVRYGGGSADVYSGTYLRFPVAIKFLRTYKWDSDRTFKVCPIVLMHHLYSPSTQHLCREVVGWKHLSHPNILPLMGISVLADPHCFLILTEWMSNGSVIQYARSNPRENRLQLVSSPPYLNFLVCLFAHTGAVRGYGWCYPSPQTQDRPWGSERGESNVPDLALTLLTGRAGEYPRRQRWRCSCR